MYTTPMRSGHPLKATSRVPKAEAPERTISQPMGFHAMDTPPMARSNAKQAHGDSTEPEESHNPTTSSMYPILRDMYRLG